MREPEIIGASGGENYLNSCGLCALKGENGRAMNCAATARCSEW
ncbi:hypothetical protein IBT49_23725 [Erwinia sp. S63]|nr:hypothetical protein [Erwinia sp. S63]